MNTRSFFDHYMIRHPSVPAVGYLAAVIVLLMIVMSAGIDVAEHYRAVTTSTEHLMRLEQHKPPSSAEHGQLVADRPPGSPFLEGQTVTIASAALLQRITDAITHAGGTVVSSEVVPQDFIRGMGSYGLPPPASSSRRLCRNYFMTLRLACPSYSSTSCWWKGPYQEVQAHVCERFWKYPDYGGGRRRNDSSSPNFRSYPLRMGRAAWHHSRACQGAGFSHAQRIGDEPVVGPIERYDCGESNARR